MINKTKIEMDKAREWLVEDSGADHFLSYDERETLKHQYGRVFQAFEIGKANMDELFAAAEGRLRGWFFRSAERLPLLHPKFSIYASMLLDEEYIRKCFPAELVQRLLEKYRRQRQRGYIDGSYWTPSQTGNFDYR